MRAYRPESVVHLAFVLDPLRTGVVDKKRMWQINVAGTSRVTEAIAEHNRMLGGIDKFIFPSSALVYGPELSKPATEDAPLNAQGLPYALHQQEADRTVQSRAKGMKCKVYILRPHVYAGATVQNYQLGVLRGIPGGKGRLGERLRRQNKRLPLWLPSRGDYLEHKFQFVHVDDVARLIAHILRRKSADPKLTVLNVAGCAGALTSPRSRCSACPPKPSANKRCACSGILAFPISRQKRILIFWAPAPWTPRACASFWASIIAR
jgi:nucleoside-diphosphate-sugar epimerase